MSKGVRKISSLRKAVVQVLHYDANGVTFDPQRSFKLFSFLILVRLAITFFFFVILHIRSYLYDSPNNTPELDVLEVSVPSSLRQT